jgi:hypothetical protein
MGSSLKRVPEQAYYERIREASQRGRGEEKEEVRTG